MGKTLDIWGGVAAREMVRTSAGPIPVIVADRGADPSGTVVLIHGRNGAPGQAHMSAIAQAYLQAGWRVAAPEMPRSSANPGSGPPEEVTLAGHTEAARHALDWARGCWPGKPLALAGHSMGGFAVAMIAGETTALHHVLAVSPVLSGQRLIEARRALGPQALEEVEREAPLYLAELECADAAPLLAVAAAPFAVATGAEDGLVTRAHARAYFDAARDARFFCALPGLHHCPAGPACDLALAAALAALGL
ncbi:alpha/beta fold hydrolase [Sulfitobacter sp. LCG007]